MTAGTELDGFAGLSLDELNARAGLLERADRKYILNEDTLAEALDIWRRDFEVLDIGGRRSFAYESIYFDDEQLRCYADHHQGRRVRFKVRTRHYVDAGLCFAEVKLKGPRGKTVKTRLPYDAANFEMLDGAALDHVRASYSALYGRAFDCDLGPVLATRYVRTTLVAKASGERITIDRALDFASGGCAVAIDPGLAVVETKSATGNGAADRLLRTLHQHPVSHCSKYCVGLVALGKVQKFNNFRAVVRMLAVGPHGPGEVQARTPAAVPERRVAMVGTSAA